MSSISTVAIAAGASAPVVAHVSFLNHLLARRLAGVLHDFDKPEMVWQGVTLVATLVLAWGGAYLVRRLINLRRAKAGRMPGSGALNLQRAMFPLIGAGLLWVAQATLDDYMPTSLLQLVSVPLFGIGLIYGLFFVARRVFARDGRASTWLAVVERVVTAIVWFGMLLTVLGIQDDVLNWLASVHFRVGKQDVSLLSLISGLIWVCVTMVVATWMGSAIEERLMRAKHLDGNLRVALSRVARALLVVAAILISLSLVGIDLTVLGVFGGALGVGLGFGLQKIASNYVSGFIILLDRSLRLGDAISVDGLHGVVMQIRTRYTVMRGLDGNETLVPNEKLITDIVLNESSYLSRGYVTTSVQVAYDADVERALKLLVEATQGVNRVLADPAPTPYLTSFDDSGITLQLGFWVADSALGTGVAKSNVNRNILKLFNAHGITIPFPQREVRVVGLPEGASAALQRASAQEAAAPDTILP